MLKSLRNTEIKLENGERIDLKDFFDFYYSELISFASRFIVNLILREDIVQEVFISFREKTMKFSQPKASLEVVKKDEKEVAEVPSLEKRI